MITMTDAAVSKVKDFLKEDENQGNGGAFDGQTRPEQHDKGNKVADGILEKENFDKIVFEHNLAEDLPGFQSGIASEDQVEKFQ